MTVTALETIRAHGVTRGVEVWPVFAGHSVRIDTWQCTAAATATPRSVTEPWPAVSFRPCRRLPAAPRRAGVAARCGHPARHRSRAHPALDLARQHRVAARQLHLRPSRGRRRPPSPAIGVAAQRHGRLRGATAIAAPPARRRLHDPQAIESIALRIYARTHAASLSVRPEPRVAPRLRHRRVQTRLAGRYLELPNLPELAASAGVSLYHFCRTFKARTGLGVSRYVHRLRLRPPSTAWPIRDQPQRPGRGVGYSSHSHFAKAFRSELAISPTELRRIASAASLRELATRLGV